MLKRLAVSGHTIVVFTNQRNLDVRREALRDFKAKVQNIIKNVRRSKSQLLQTPLPVWMFVAMGDDEYRKPRTGMWELMSKELSTLDCQIDMDASFFVGDADGSLASHQSSDRKFAMNVGVVFFTPEAFFLGRQTPKFTLDGFDPALHIRPSSEHVAGSHGSVMLVGPRFVGKTFYASNFLPKHKTVSSIDELLQGVSEHKCIAIGIGNRSSLCR